MEIGSDCTGIFMRKKSPEGLFSGAAEANQLRLIGRRGGVGVTTTAGSPGSVGGVT